MKTGLIFVAGFLFNIIQCFDSGSFEYNGIEVSPLYETIIYNDIADVINEFENNNVAHEKAYNESESDDEDIEDLLSEYHHYLEKAHKQRVNYLEKNKLKNKVPLIHHDKFSKMKSSSAGIRKDHYKNSFYNSGQKFPPALNPFNFNMFIPYNSNKFLTTSEQPAYNDLIMNKILLSDDSPKSSLSSIPVRSSCCKGVRESKPFSMSMDHMQQGASPVSSDEDKTFILNNPEQSDDTINIRIKVDVQLPKSQQDRVQHYNLQSRDRMTDYDAGVSKEYLSALKLPSPYFNFPIPMSMFGYKKTPIVNKHDTSPQHKMSVHKKKKSKTGNSNKKHRKKVITFHNIKLEPQLFQTHFGMFNLSNANRNETESNNTVILNLQSNKTQMENSNITTLDPLENTKIIETQTEENILLLVNITNNIDNGTNEKHKAENSIETEYTNAISNVTTTDLPMHLIKKREIPSQTKPTEPAKKHINTQKKSTVQPNKSTAGNIKSNKTQISALPKKISVQKPSSIKKKGLPKSKNVPYVKMNTTKVTLDKEKSNIKYDKNFPTDTELLYWPSNNGSKSKKDISKNITTFILESENKKAKLNMTTETLRRNHTRALEQAIFGNVNWNDVDAVAPAFISFIGKYIEGILTFCNERNCHSMNCAQKMCMHRVCAPQERFNNKGHCTGSSLTDSAASMESLMDLPSNIAFEIVDILQDRMNGKLFGKTTLCINSKCITFAAYKKIFLKVKCTVKELSPKGHCVNLKENKVA